MSASCRICGKPLRSLLQSMNENAKDDDDPIHIPSPEVLGKPSSVRRLAMAYRAKELPRRKILDFVSFHLDHHGGPILYLGESVSFADSVDDAFDTDRDPSERWLGRFLAFGITPPIQQAQTRVMTRLLMLWVALAIHNREQAELVIR
jgi:hypothetical protein